MYHEISLYLYLLPTIAMNKEPRNLATYKEFGKMLRAVADIYSQMGDTPLDFQDFIQPWKDAFLRNPIDVTEAKKWAAYVKSCRDKGIPCDYQEYEKQKG